MRRLPFTYRRARSVPVNITLENIDLTNTEHLAHAREICATLSSPLLATVQDIRIDFRTLDLVPMHAAEDVPADMGHDAPKASSSTPKAMHVKYGKTTRTFLHSMLTRIEKGGTTTLEEVAHEMNISLDTARAYLRNAGRTAAAYKVPLPVKPVWNHERGCNDYHANVV